MDSVDVDSIIEEFFPDKKIAPRYLKVIKYILGEDKISSLLQAASGKRGIQWIEAIAEFFQLRFETHCADYDNIPSRGPAIVVSNHPTVMDGLALISTVAMVRKDIKIISNHVLSQMFPPIKDVSIGIRNMQGKISPRQFKEMNDHLKKGGVLIICPAGRLASVSLYGLKEAPWHTGFAQLALRNNAALVPVLIKGRNSIPYYLTALLFRPLSNLMLIHECYRHRGKRMRIKICQQIAFPANAENDYATIAADLRIHLQRIGRNKPGILPVQPTLSRPEKRELLINALRQCEILKTLSDGKMLYLYRYQREAYSPILRELGRLREVSFRAIGAGTGNNRDNDVFDNEYYHVLLWDPLRLEIAGAYRIMPAREQIENRGVEGLYSHSLFNYNNEGFLQEVEKSIEIGRGFIQKEYQKTNALDALWKGIFCFILKYPEYKYLLGILTIPRTYSTQAQQLIVSFYNIYFSSGSQVCFPPEVYTVKDKNINSLFCGDNFSEDWITLNKNLREWGCDLPWPYKQAAKWYSEGGSKLLCFIEDEHFNSIAGLNFCEIKKLKRAYFKHYIRS